VYITILPADEKHGTGKRFVVGQFGKWYKDCATMQEAAEVFQQRFGKALTDQEVAAYEQGFLYISLLWDSSSEPVCDLIEPVERWRGLLAYTTRAKTDEFLARYKRFRELFPEIKLPESTERRIKLIREGKYWPSYWQW